jgi:hypothetical protein
MAVLVILYKYDLNALPESLLGGLIRIIMNSLEAQFHQCRRIPTTILTQDTTRRSEFKEPSVGFEPEEREQSIHSNIKPVNQVRKPHDSSIECDDTESELVAIPESDLSDSTLQGSIDGGMSDEIPVVKKKLERQKYESSKSVSEGMRMMFQSAILSPPVNVQKAIVVTQTPSSKPTQAIAKDSSTTQQIIAAATTSQLRTVSAVVGELQQQPQRVVVQPYNGNGNRRSISPIRALGRQQRIIDTNGHQPSTSSSSDDNKKSSTAHFKSFDRRNIYGSPESPLSRMDILSPPDTDVSTDGNETPLLTPTNVRLEFPMPERLLPIGNMGKEGIANICERVREALSIPDISHLKSQDNLDKTTSENSPQNSSRGTSPRKLTKQVALLESPPNVHDGLVDFRQVIVKKLQVKHDGDDRPKVVRKVGAYAVHCTDNRLTYAGSWAPPSLTEDDCEEDEDASARSGYETRQSSFRIGDECLNERCSECK